MLKGKNARIRSETEPVERPVWASWFFGIRWFAGQYAIVVAGILTALALQAWYENQQREKDWNKALLDVQADIALDTIALNRSINSATRQINQLEVLLDSAARKRLSEDSLQRMFNYGPTTFVRSTITTAGYDRLSAVESSSRHKDEVRKIVTQFYNRDIAYSQEWDQIARRHSVEGINPYLVENVPFSLAQVSRQSKGPAGALRFSSADAALIMRQPAFQRLLLRHHYIKVAQREAYLQLMVKARATEKAIEQATQ